MSYKQKCFSDEGDNVNLTQRLTKCGTERDQYRKERDEYRKERDEYYENWQNAEDELTYVKHEANNM